MFNIFFWVIIKKKHKKISRNSGNRVWNTSAEILSFCRVSVNTEAVLTHQNNTRIRVIRRILKRRVLDWKYFEKHVISRASIIVKVVPHLFPYRTTNILYLACIRRSFSVIIYLYFECSVQVGSVGIHYTSSSGFFTFCQRRAHDDYTCAYDAGAFANKWKLIKFKLK